MSTIMSSVDDIVQKIQQLVINADLYYLHLKNGTIEEYYEEILETIVNDMAIVPLYRMSLGLDPEDDKTEVRHALTTIMIDVANLFEKSIDDVEGDLIHVMNTFPIIDVQAAIRLKLEGKLH